MAASSSWESLLGAPAPRDHIVQLYADDGFLVRAVAHFIGTGLAAGEAGILFATPAHLGAVTERLGAAHDVPGALARDQLVLLDADTCLAGFMADVRPDRGRFHALAGSVLARVRRAGHARVRLFGEMVALLWQDNPAAALRLEALWNDLLAERRASLLCAYGLDNFDHHLHRGPLPRITRAHSHLVPVEDYARLDAAVAQAYRDVFGDCPDTTVLRELLTARPPGPAMPPAQAALLALRNLRPDLADDVLARAHHYYTTP
jgi:hypothetical protein